MSAPTGDKGVALVTGGSRGIGAAIAHVLSEAGYPVALVYSRDKTGAAGTQAEIEAKGGRARIFRADLALESDIVALFRELEGYGRLSAVVNNAGGTGPLCRMEDVTGEAMAALMALNVVAPILICREAIRRMSTRHGGPGGSIVNISSRAAQLGGAGEWVHYAATKGAIDSMTVGLAREVAAEGIRVNAVSPGVIRTGLHEAAGAPQRLEKAPSVIPMGRIGEPEEVASVVAFLCSDLASFVNGSNYRVDSGSVATI